MSQRVLAADNEAILAAEIEVINPTTQHLRTFLPVIGDGSGETVVVGSQITVTSTSTGRTKVVDHVGHDVAVVEPRGSKQFIAVEFPGYGWHHMDLPVNYPASRVTGGGAGGGVTLPILESDVTNLPTDLAGKAATVHTHAAADVASGTLASARLPVATTVAMGATEVDNNSAGSPVALTASGHGSAADPHPQYALDTEKGAVSGIATLDGAGKLASSQLPLGTSASTAAAGNDSRLSDNRTPLAHKASHQSGGSDELSVAGLLGVLANPQPPIIGSTSTTAVAGNDSRLADSRTPTAHASTHQPGGTDALAVDAAAATGSLRTLGAGAQQAVSGTDTRLPVIVRLTADNAAIAAAAPTTALQVANLTLAALIGQEWDIEWILEIANSVASDVFVFNVTSTAGTLTGRYTVESSTGVPTAGAGVVKLLMNPAGTLTTATANAPGATGTIGLVLTVVVRARVKLTVSNGTIQLLLRAGTNAAASSGTATVKAQSQMIASRLA